MENQRDTAPADIGALSYELAELLDKVSVRSKAGFETGTKLNALMDGWRASGGSPEGQSLIQEAQAAAGMINATGEGDPMRDHAYRQLTDLKNRLRATARPA